LEEELDAGTWSKRDLNRLSALRLICLFAVLNAFDGVCVGSTQFMCCLDDDFCELFVPMVGLNSMLDNSRAGGLEGVKKINQFH
jgi:hypothetical protein